MAAFGKGSLPSESDWFILNSVLEASIQIPIKYKLD